MALGSGSLRDMVQQTSEALQLQIDALESQLPGSQPEPVWHSESARSRSPRRSHGGPDPTRGPIGGADADCGLGLMSGSRGRATSSSQFAPKPHGTAEGLARASMQQQQQELHQQHRGHQQLQQEFMMRQYNAMQQMVMGQMMAQMMGANAMAMMGSPSCTAETMGDDPEETQRRMGQQVLANTMAALSRREMQDDEDCDDGDDVPQGRSANVLHPNYRPGDMEIIPGLTDKRFEGRLKLWFEDKGYGFVECLELRKKYPDVDVFLHQNQRRHFPRGTYISFSVFINFRGRPQATELRRRAEPGAHAS